MCTRYENNLLCIKNVKDVFDCNEMCRLFFYFDYRIGLLDSWLLVLASLSNGREEGLWSSKFSRIRLKTSLSIKLMKHFINGSIASFKLLEVRYE